MPAMSCSRASSDKVNGAREVVLRLSVVTLATGSDHDGGGGTLER